MKSLTILIFAFGCSSAFGQAMSMPANSNEFREFSSNAEPIHVSSSERLNSNAPAVEQDFERILTQPNNQNSGDLSIVDIVAILDDRIAMSEDGSGELKERP
mgnify:CR=1 FL=1